MFVDSRLADRQRTASSFSEAYKQYQATAESWFDGSVGSIDKRLARANKLIHSAKSTVARMAVSESQQYLRAAEHLGADLHALAGLRDDLLTGASGRADVTGPPGWRTSHWAQDAIDAGHQFPVGGPDPLAHPDFKSWQDASNLHSHLQNSMDTFNPPGAKTKFTSPEAQQGFDSRFGGVAPGSDPGGASFKVPQVPVMPSSVGAKPKKTKNSGEPDGWKAPTSQSKLGSQMDHFALHREGGHPENGYGPGDYPGNGPASAWNDDPHHEYKTQAEIDAQPKPGKSFGGVSPESYWESGGPEVAHYAAYPPEAYMKDSPGGGQSMWDPNVGDWAVDSNMGADSHQPWTNEQGHEYAGYGGVDNAHNPYNPHYGPFNSPDHVGPAKDPNAKSHVSDSVSPLYRPPPAAPKRPEGDSSWPTSPPRSGHPAPDAYDKLPALPPHKIPKMWDDRGPEPSPSNISPSEARAPGNAQYARLASTDQRWVDLESSRFVTANSDTLDDSHELATRAHNYATLVTSTFSGRRSAAVSRAFVERVVKLGQQAYRPAVRRQAAADPDFGDQAIFL